MEHLFMFCFFLVFIVVFKAGSPIVVLAGLELPVGSPG